tara:strand:+ start:2883 stop:3656 length:774 start_codon:yes stop_codon:yes gene_type:complete
MSDDENNTVEVEQSNDNLVLITGVSGTGKSASLHKLENPEDVLYLNCESGKRLPFSAKFRKGANGRVGVTITDPYQVYGVFDAADSMGAKTIIIDSLTYLMDMFESNYVLNSDDSRKAWGDYQQFFKKLMQDKVAKSKQAVIFTGHTLAFYNEEQRIIENKMPVKGALKNQGLESYFSLVVSTKKVKIADLEDYKNDLLNITEDDKLVGYKHVFQTRITGDTVNERIRSPMGMFTVKETFIDNDVQALLNRIKTYYN